MVWLSYSKLLFNYFHIILLPECFIIHSVHHSEALILLELKWIAEQHSGQLRQWWLAFWRVLSLTLNPGPSTFRGLGTKIHFRNSSLLTPMAISPFTCYFPQFSVVSLLAGSFVLDMKSFVISSSLPMPLNRSVFFWIFFLSSGEAACWPSFFLKRQFCLSFVFLSSISASLRLTWLMHIIICQ